MTPETSEMTEDDNTEDFYFNDSPSSETLNFLSIFLKEREIFQ